MIPSGGESSVQVILMICIYLTVAKCLPDVLPSSLVNPPVQISPGGFVDYGSKVTITCNIPGRDIINKSRTCVFNPTQQKYMLQGDTYECGGNLFLSVR